MKNGREGQGMKFGAQSVEAISGRLLRLHEATVAKMKIPLSWGARILICGCISTGAVTGNGIQDARRG